MSDMSDLSYLTDKNTMPRFLYKIRILLALFLFACFLSAAQAECPKVPFKSKADSSAIVRALKSTKAQSIDEACLCSIAAVSAESGCVSIVREFLRLADEFTAKQGFSLSLLCRLADKGLPGLQAEKLIALWKKRNGPVSDLARKLDQADDFPAEDSLLSAADHCRFLTIDQLLQWAHIRELQGKLSGSAEVYCKVLRTDPHGFGTITERISLMLEEAPEDSIISALGILRRSLAYPGVDTVPAQYWIADFYRQHGLDSLEQELLLSIPATIGRVLPRFEELAHAFFSQGRYAKAILPACSYYAHSANRQTKAMMADIIYQSFQELHCNDSALAWLLRAGVSGNKKKIDAAVLFQLNGRLNEAQSIIMTLDRSLFSRDTLELRQKLFSGDTAGILALVNKPRTGWDGHPDDRLQWTARILLYSGAVDQLTALLDSVPLSYADHAPEMLNCRLVFQKYRGEREWLADWCLVQRSLFLGKPATVCDRIWGKKHSPDLQDPLLLCITRWLTQQGNYTAALQIFDRQGDSAATPEYLYYHAEVLTKSRHPGKARELLMRIIRDYPDSIFSEKARVLLAGFPKIG